MEVLSVLFGAVTIVLGVLAIIIAVLAIWGYHAIKEESSGVASGAAKTAALDYIKSEEVQRKLREESRKIIDEEMIKIREGLALALSQPSQDVQTAATQQESTKKVGKRYSGKRDG
jgi:Na+-translocating ferredoxin:NAD+ oxidoreductase RnfG subunit